MLGMLGAVLRHLEPCSWVMRAVDNDLEWKNPVKEVVRGTSSGLVYI